MQTLGNRLVFAGPCLLRTERERDSIGPPKTVLRRILAAAGLSARVDDVVLLHHAARRAVGALNQREPAARGFIGQVGAAVAPHSFDREPLERRPAVGRVPLLSGGDLRGHEATGTKEFLLES